MTEREYWQWREDMDVRMDAIEFESELRRRRAKKEAALPAAQDTTPNEVPTASPVAEGVDSPASGAEGHGEVAPPRMQPAAAIVEAAEGDYAGCARCEASRELAEDLPAEPLWKRE